MLTSESSTAKSLQKAIAPTNPQQNTNQTTSKAEVNRKTDTTTQNKTQKTK
jgi:hypothetical protein